jgi:hypothetical protein
VVGDQVVAVGVVVVRVQVGASAGRGAGRGQGSGLSWSVSGVGGADTEEVFSLALDATIVAVAACAPKEGRRSRFFFKNFFWLSLRFFLFLGSSGGGASWVGGEPGREGR